MGRKKLVVQLILLTFACIQAEDEHTYDWREFKFRASSKILNDWAHLEQITRRMVEIFEEKHVSGTNLPISDQSIVINETVRGYNAEGKVILHAGFVNKLSSITDRKNRYAFKEDKAILSSQLYLSGLSIAYDVDLQLDGSESTGTILFTFSKITYNLTVEEDVNTKEIETSMSPWPFLCKQFEYQAFPFDKRMQMTIKGLQKSDLFCENLERSMKNWQIDECLEQAAQEIGFPPVCYYCAQED